MTPMPPLNRNAASSAEATAETNTAPTNDAPHIPSRNWFRYFLIISPTHIVALIPTVPAVALTLYDLKLAFCEQLKLTF